MIDYLIGVDGGGTNTRVRLARRDGTELATGSSGASGLRHGIDKAWRAVLAATGQAFATIGIDTIPMAACAIGLGLAGVHNKEWAAAFHAANPGFGALVLDTDGFTTLMGAHGGRPGAIVAIGTGSVGEALRADGTRVEVGGWGFPAGDEASGAWMGLRAIGHVQQVLDGRTEGGAFADAVIAACGGARDPIQVWLGHATQTDYAGLARFVVAHGASDPVAAPDPDTGRHRSGQHRACARPVGAACRWRCAAASATRCAPTCRPPRWRAARPPHGDSAAGALRMIELHLKDTNP